MTDNQIASVPQPDPVTCTFRTKDINQAAFIWCQPGAELLRIEGADKGGRSPKTSIFFVFTLSMDERNLSLLIIQYANRKSTVEPQDYVSRQNNLRDLLHGSLRRRPEDNRK